MKGTYIRLVLFLFIANISFAFAQSPEQQALEVLKLTNLSLESASDFGKPLESASCSIPPLSQPPDCSRFFDDLSRTEKRSITSKLECFKNSFTNCATTSMWLKRDHKDYKHQDRSKVRSRLVQTMDLLSKVLAKPGAQHCIDGASKIKSNLCFLQSNLDELRIKEYKTRVKPDGLFNDYDRTSQWLVLSPALNPDIEFAVSAKRDLSNISSMYIVEKGTKPFAGSGKKNIVGLVDFRKKRFNLQNPKMNSNTYNYYKREVTTFDFGYGADFVIPFASVNNDISNCNNFSMLGLNLNKAIKKLGAGWGPGEAERIALSVQGMTALEAGLIASYNFQDAGKEFIESVKNMPAQLWGLVTNKEIPDPEGDRQCQEKENIKEALLIKNKCSGMFNVLMKTIGSAAEDIINPCLKKSCSNDISNKNGVTNCLALNAGNPIFTLEMSVCVDLGIKKKISKKAYELISHCLTRGGDEFSRCMAKVAVNVGVAAVGGAGLQLAKGASLSASSVTWLNALGRVSKGGAIFTADMLLNPLPIGPESMFKVLKIQKGLLLLKSTKGTPKDVLKEVDNRLADIDKILKQKEFQLPEHIIKNASLSRAARIKQVRKLLEAQSGGTPITEKVVQSVIRAHEEIPTIVGQVSIEQMIKKVRIMREAGLSQKQTRLVLDQGLAGYMASADEIIASMRNSDKIVFYDGSIKRPLPLDEFKPGDTYTTVLHDGKLIIGKNISGTNGVIGGPASHLTLLESVGADSTDLFNYTGGALRINEHGIVDISGYHTKQISDTTAQAQKDIITEVSPYTKTRITGDRLKTLYDLEIKNPQSLINAQLDQAGRISKIQQVLTITSGKAPSQKHIDAVMRAHSDVPTLVGEASVEELLKKYRIMKEAGLSNKEARVMINSGLAGMDVLKVENMSIFFKEVELGKRILKDSAKTKVKFQGQAVFRMNTKNSKYPALSKGDYFYLDNLHKDHIEVFNSNGNFKHVINLDGTINLDKSSKAQGRKIKVR